MALVIKVTGSDIDLKDYHFDDSHERINIGRDPGECQIVFPAGETVVGRHHCGMRRVLGRYRLVLNDKNLVFVDETPAIDDQELPAKARVRLGPAGPVMLVETVGASMIPPTDEHGTAIPKTVMIRQAHQKSQRATAIGVGAFLALIAAAGAGLWYMSQQDEEIETLKGKSEEAVAVSQGQQEWLTNIAQSQEEIEEELEAKAPSFEPIIADVQKSVYLVFERDAKGHERPWATAWVADSEKGILGTNGHVAELFDLAEPGSTLLVRSAVDPDKDFVIDRVQYHPGYDEFSKVWSAYGPVRPATKYWEEIDAAGPACDVALMFVKDPKELGPSLPLASDEELKTLTASAAVAFVGFPMEGLVLGGVTVQSPTPTSQVGHITAVTDYFGSRQGSFEDMVLIHHALPSAGGASGSPIVNEAGHVVAVLNAGNVLGISESGARIGSSAQINYGQRIDLLKELLEGRAEAAQEVRSQRWREGLGKFYARRVVLARDVLEEYYRSKWVFRAENFGDFESTVAELSPVAASADEASGNGNEEDAPKQRYAVDKADSVWVAVMDDDDQGEDSAEPDDEAGAASKPPEIYCTTASAGRLLIDAESIDEVGLYLCMIPSDKSKIDIEVAMTTAKQQARAFSLTRGALRSAEDRVEQARNYLNEQVEGQTGEQRRGNAIFDDTITVKLGKADKGDGGAAVQEVAVKSAGYYGLLVVPKDGSDVNIRAAILEDGKEAASAEDNSSSTWGGVVLRVYDPSLKTIQIAISGPKPDVECLVEAYQFEQ